MASKRKKRAGRKPRQFQVKASLVNTTLAKAKSALTLQLYSRNVKLGELQIGQGSLYWWGAYRQKARRVNWRRFAEMMDRLAYGKKN